MNQRTLPSLAKAFEKHYDELKSFVSRKVGCAALAEDIVQEAWVRVASNTPAEPVSNSRAYLYRIAHNLVIDRIRRDRVQSRHVVNDFLAENIPSNDSSPENWLVHRERLDTLMKAVEELPPRCRQVFRMRKFEQLDQSEIARRLGITRSMVEKHLRKALAHCLSRLEETE